LTFAGKAFGQGTPPLSSQGKGIPARRHHPARRLGVVGLSGVGRCTTSGLRRIPPPNPAHQPLELVVGQR
jgi:hypothetical protein